ncbi:MAG: 2-oxoacid:acceptor oxidoreductase subunit alpha, partial [Methanomicrobiales archaeon]|nr:2-oxoacid:acceptor oxidoreductase subunit alpha [Methanomicrobiales archaeon]
VIVNIQRGGPSTGQPTLGAQGDILQCRFGSHGDYSLIALSPASVQEMFELTVKAFHLSEKYRVPAFLMADEIIGHMRERLTIPDSVDVVARKKLDPGTLPFKPGDGDIPGFPSFGEGYGVHVTGLTHDERGYPAATNPPAHERLVTRLVRKVESARKEIADYRVTNPDAEQVFISYGAPTRTVHQVLHDRPKEGIGHLQLRVVWPFPEFALSEFNDAKAFLVPEMNLGQISREIERHTDVPVIPVPKIGGDLHTPAELGKALEGSR